MKKEENGFGSKSCFTQPVTAGFFLFIGQSNCLSVLIFWQWVLDASPSGTTLNIKKQPATRNIYDMTGAGIQIS